MYLFLKTLEDGRVHHRGVYVPDGKTLDIEQCKKTYKAKRMLILDATECESEDELKELKKSRI